MNIKINNSLLLEYFKIAKCLQCLEEILTSVLQNKQEVQQQHPTEENLKKLDKRSEARGYCICFEFLQQ